MASTDKRRLFRAGMKAALDAYKASVSAGSTGYLAHVYDHPPGGTPKTPCGYVEKRITSTISFGGSVRQRVLRGRVVFLNKVPSNDQVADEQDTIADLFIDTVTSLSRTAVSGCVMLPAGEDDEAETRYDPGQYAALAIDIELFVQEGRTI